MCFYWDVHQKDSVMCCPRGKKHECSRNLLEAVATYIIAKKTGSGSLIRLAEEDVLVKLSRYADVINDDPASKSPNR